MILLSNDQLQEIKAEKLYEEQQKLADQGISTAREEKTIVTIGDYDCDYLNWKEFILAQIFHLGYEQFCDETGWDKNELVEELSDSDCDDQEWVDTAVDNFDGMQGED